MKKLLVFSILFFGIFPLIHKGKLVLSHVSTVYADDYGSEGGGDGSGDDTGDDPTTVGDDATVATPDYTVLYQALSDFFGVPVEGTTVDNNGNTVLILNDGTYYDPLTQEEVDPSDIPSDQDLQDEITAVDDIVANLKEVRITSVRSEMNATEVPNPDGSVIKVYDEVWTNSDGTVDSHHAISFAEDVPYTYQAANYNGDALFGSNFIGPGPDQDPFTLGLTPVDAMDKAAELHDYLYWEYGAGGMDAFSDPEVRFADLQLLNSAQAIVDSYINGGIDSVTGLPTSTYTYMEASAVVALFTPIVQGKFASN